MFKKQHDSDIIIRLRDGAFIAPDEGNLDYQEVQEWLKAGNQLVEPDPKPVIDEVDRIDLIILRVLFNHENRVRVLEGKQAVTMAQFRTAIKALL